MSKYLTFDDVTFKSRKLLVAALVGLGYAESVIEVHETPQALYGYHGDRRKEEAEVVIRRKNTGIGSSNDIGFAWSAEKGGYVPVVSEYDNSSLRGGNFVRDVRVGYSEAVVAEVTRRMNGRVTKETGGKLIRMKVRW